MSRKAALWVVPVAVNWWIRREKSSRITKEFTTQKQAIKSWIVMAKNQKTELVIQSKKGKIREKNSYGKDNFPPQG